MRQRTLRTFKKEGAVRIRTWHVFLAWLALAGGVACGGAADRRSAYALQVRLGSYEDGSGRVGTALIATLRDARGNGPTAPWTLTLHDPAGTSVAVLQSVGGPGAYLASWYAGLAPEPGGYELVAENGGEILRTSVSLSAVGGLGLPGLTLEPTGSRIDWAPIPGAVAYLCRVYAGGVLQAESSAAAPSCDLSALPDGGYSAEILALTADLAALATNAARSPTLPDRFDVSVSRLGLVRGVASAPMILRAAGGAYDDGVDQRALAIWLSITAPDGSATASTWDVEVVGPNLPASAPLALTYHANFPRTLAWAVGLPAVQGTYTATARSGTTAVSTQLVVGAPAWLAVPLGLVATDGAQGSASASWLAVDGAGSYLASAYDSVSGALVASAWFSGTSGSFPQGTFVAGQQYDVYVAAADVDMTLDTAPTQVSVAENVFDASRFVAR